MLTNDQQKAFSLLTKGYSVFITGPAGTGKGYVLSHFINTTKKRIGVTSTTGISALQIKGSTVHSYLGLGLGEIPGDRY